MQDEEHIHEAAESDEFRQPRLEHFLPGVGRTRQLHRLLSNSQTFQRQVIQPSPNGDHLVPDARRQFDSRIRRAIGDPAPKDAQVRRIQSHRPFRKRNAQRRQRSVPSQIVAPSERPQDHQEERGLAEPVDSGDYCHALLERPCYPAPVRIPGEELVVRDP